MPNPVAKIPPILIASILAEPNSPFFCKSSDLGAPNRQQGPNELDG
jgi:hypothetical protein